MSLRARVTVFVAFPIFMGLCAVGVSYIQTLSPQAEGEEPHAIDFDRDFVWPFLLSLAFVIVIGFQTNGFTGERRAALVWPKARTVQRVRRERVVVDDSLEDDLKKTT